MKIWSPTQSPLPIGVSNVRFDGDGDAPRLFVESLQIKGKFEGYVDFQRGTMKGLWSQGKDTEIELKWSVERPE